jgi:hypothetical protein
LFSSKKSNSASDRLLRTVSSYQYSFFRRTVNILHMYRRRPDLRLLEEGRLEEAEAAKVQL